ncbi:MAG TPA: NAD-dependent epimerase/dehydratase family protein [Caulobacteraceae bacterium]|jgi:nucleoside-diphosphate-sugar epimerase
MRVLITGAGGFLGGALARRLAGRADTQVIASTRAAVDLTDAASIRRAVGEAAPDIVVHAAGRSYGAAQAVRDDNVTATANLVEALEATAPAARLILLGSAAQYGVSQTCQPWCESDPALPAGAYGAAKQAAEAQAFASGLRVTALRLFNVVSTSPQGEQVFDSFLRRAAAAPAGRVRMGPLGAVRDFVAADDVLAAIERVIDRAVWGETINVCTGVGRTVRSLLEATAAAIPGGVRIEEDDGPAGLPWSVGDPGRCEALLGLRPSSDMTSIVQGAAAWVVAQAKGGADARSRA